MGNSKNTSLGGDALKLTASKVIAMCISMVIAMLLSRFRTLEEYGTYSQILLAINLMTSLMLLGLPNSINYFLALSETDKEKQKFVSVYYTFSTILSVIVGLILICATPFMSSYFNNELIKDFIYFLAIYPWAKIIQSGIENIMVVYHKTSSLFIFRVLNSLSLLSIVLIVHAFKWSFQTYMLLFVLVESIFAISIYIIVKRISGKLTVSFDISIIKKVLLFSIPIGLASVVGTLNIELDRLMIGIFLDTEQLAIYTNASREMPVTIVAISLTAVLLPRLARLLKKGQNQKAANLWGNSTVLSYIIICFLASGFFIFASDVMRLLYSEKYLPGVSVFRVYNLVLLLKCTYFGMILNAKGKTKFIFYSSIISLVLNVVMSYFLFFTFGFIGPAIATFLSQLIIIIIQLNFTAKVVNIRFMKILPWKMLGLITLVNVLLGLLFLELKRISSIDILIGNLLESLLLTVIWGALYFLIFFKEIKKQWNALNKGE
ncbi:oligosaccharide flippase family protein [Paenibacillus odorifer]|uniref:oligosaccharide flippase family protein n=1 Tax=Paenibacillus odorifer TaxID=189426 RepID=UPI00096D6AA1|nr:oligosaccharide flippase family protein [Paenibacillus odorifer]OMD89414.1 hypothetical protein BSK67_25150 [Paenibacillus odorifer]